MESSQARLQSMGLPQFKRLSKKDQIKELRRVGVEVQDEAANKSTYEAQYDAYLNGKEATTETNKTVDMRTVLLSPTMPITPMTADILNVLRFRHNHGVEETGNSKQDCGLRESLAAINPVVHGLSDAMRSMPTSSHVGTNLQLLHAQLVVPKETANVLTNKLDLSEILLVQRAMRGSILMWMKEFPPVPEADLKWPRDYTKGEQIQLRQLTRDTMLQNPEVWTKVMKSGELEEAIEALKETLPKGIGAPRNVLRILISEHRSNSGYNAMRRKKTKMAHILEDGDGNGEEAEKEAKY